MATPAPNPTTCPRCGAPAVWHAQLSQWGCDHCRQLIAAPPQPQPAQPAQATPFCPRCWSPGTWHAQAGRWGCDKCRTMLEAAPAGAPVVTVGATHPDQLRHSNDAGAKVGKFVLWLVLIVILVVIKMAARGAFR